MGNSDLYTIDPFKKEQRYSLFSLANWKNGLAFKNINFSESGKPIIKIAELNNGISENTARTNGRYDSNVSITKGDLLFAWSGNPETSIDVYRYKLEDGWLNQHIFKVTPDNNLVDENYFYYLLKYLKPTFKKIASNKQTTGLGHVTLADLKLITVCLHSLVTQRKIASILSVIDDKIELNNRMNDNLEEQAKSIFKTIFLEYKDGEQKIGDYITPQRGKNLLSKNFVDGPYPVVAGGLEAAGYHNKANTTSPVLTISSSGANAGYVRLWMDDVWSSDSSYIDSRMTQNVFFWYVLLKLRQQEIFDSQTGSAQAHIYPMHIAALPIGKVKNSDISEYNDAVKPMFEIIKMNTNENKRLAELRDTLLPKLMSGEIDVDAIEL